VLLASGLVPEAGEERDAAEARGGQGDERNEDEVTEPAHEEGWAGGERRCFGRDASVLRSAQNDIVLLRREIFRLGDFCLLVLFWGHAGTWPWLRARWRMAPMR